MSDKKVEIKFLGLGAEKAGTTWVANTLAKHPEVFIPKEKELFFFNDLDPHFLKKINSRYQKWGYGWFNKKFSSAQAGQLKGELCALRKDIEEAVRR